MPVIKRIYDDNEYLRYNTTLTLSNGTVGKQIEIDGFETNYIITENAKVININTEYELKPHIGKYCPYKTVNIQLGHRGKYRTMTIHRLLGYAYIPNIEHKPIINHIDGDKYDLNLNNLEWVTYSENNKHAYIFGLKNKPVKDSESSNLTTHTKEDVIEVCELLQKGWSPSKIAKYKKVGYDFIIKIKNGSTWKSISKDYIFPNIKRYSNIFTIDEIDKMNELFKYNKSVKEVIDIMGFEYNEKTRGNVKYLYSKYHHK